MGVASALSMGAPASALSMGGASALSMGGAKALSMAHLGGARWVQGS